MSSFIMFNKSWKTFRMDDVFIFHKGKRLTKEDMNPGGTNFIGAIDDDNGIRQGIDLPPSHHGNCITVNYNGSVGEAFYQDKPFRASDDVNILYPKKWQLTQNIGLFLCTIIRANKYRFSYGRKWNLEKMRETLIALPVDKNDLPDWGFIHQYIERLTDESKIKTKIKRKYFPIDITDWGVFYIEDIFKIINGKGITEEEISEVSCGKIPCIQGGDLNNGVLGYFSEKQIKDKRYQYISEPSITLARVGSAGSVNFHDKCFIGDKAKSLVLNEEFAKYKNKDVYLFLIPILQANRYRYAYGRGVVSDVYKKIKIKLPVDTIGKPNFQYMEDYIKSLPYSDLI